VLFSIALNCPLLLTDAVDEWKLNPFPVSVDNACFPPNCVYKAFENEEDQFN